MPIDADHKARQYRKQQEARKTYDARRPKGPMGRPPTEDRRVLLGARVRVSVIARAGRMYDEAVAMKKYPWKSKSDMYEDFIVKGIGVYAAHGDDTAEDAMEYLLSMEAARLNSALRIEAQAVFSKTKLEINELLGIKATGAACNLYHVMMRTFFTWTRTVWRDWITGEMERTFPQLAKMKPPKVSTDEDRSGDHYAPPPTRRSKGDDHDPR